MKILLFSQAHLGTALLIYFTQRNQVELHFDLPLMYYIIFIQGYNVLYRNRGEVRGYTPDTTNNKRIHTNALQRKLCIDSITKYSICFVMLLSQSHKCIFQGLVH